MSIFRLTNIRTNTGAASNELVCEGAFAGYFIAGIDDFDGKVHR